jgi:hypothetical protein
VIGVGERAPDVRLWVRPGEDLGLEELAGAAGYLLLFYLVDWSST